MALSAAFLCVLGYAIAAGTLYGAHRAGATLPLSTLIALVATVGWLRGVVALLDRRDRQNHP